MPSWVRLILDNLNTCVVGWMMTEKHLRPCQRYGEIAGCFVGADYTPVILEMDPPKLHGAAERVERLQAEGVWTE